MQNPSKKTASHLGSLVLTMLLALSVFLIAIETFAAVSDTEALPDDGKIEVVYPADRLVPYRERRSTWGATFGIQNEQMYPGNFTSQYDGFAYEKMFGQTPINIIQGHAGVKYNFGAGALAAGLLLGAGSVYDTIIRYEYTPVQDIDSELEITKMGASFSYLLDTLFAEPYVVPYIEGQIVQLNWQESTVDLEAKSGTTDFSTVFTVGALIQLNWLDPASSLEANKNSGLENTYLDLFVSQYQASSGEDDPNFETDFNFGAGLRFEF